MLRSLLFFCAFAALGLASIPSAEADPAVARHVVHAVADGDTPRILVRWNQLDGVKRFTYYEVRRRAADQVDAVAINIDPIGPMTTAAAIEALFTNPANADALAQIVETLGADYANDLLGLQNPAPGTAAVAQAQTLPDLNYGAAIALGLGLLDESVVLGTTYVYEVWGLDANGFPSERLGRATATAGSPALLPSPAALSCVDLGDARKHLSASLRWTEGATAQDAPLAGYEVRRARRLGNGTCPSLDPGSPGARSANQVPQRRHAPGSPALGFSLFQANCVSCHPGGREVAPVVGKTMRDFDRRRFAELWSTPAEAAHDTAALQALNEEQLRAIFDHISEFHFRDDGTDTPEEVPQAGETFCYDVRPIDLLGQIGLPSPVVQCEIPDALPPDTVARVRAKRVPQAGTHEICEVAWDKLEDLPGQSAQSYRVYRADDVPRLRKDEPTAHLAEIVHAGAPARPRWLDTTQTAANAGESYFYAVRAVDVFGNLSPFSGWAPCVPRDLAPPGQATLTYECPRGCTGCEDRRGDTRWLDAEGDPNFVIADERCRPQLTPSAPGDPFRYRQLRSFNGIDYEPGQDVSGPFQVDFTPTVETPIYVKVRPYDWNLNFGVESPPVKFIGLGIPLPAPRIVSVIDAGNGRLKIIFKSLAPDRLIGFTLYKQYQGPDDADPTPREFVYRFSNANLGSEYTPGTWAVKAGAKPLAELPGFISTVDPVSNTFVYYNDLDGVYVMQANVGEVADIVLSLHAVGWSGKEGLTIPTPWDGWIPGDKIVDWPMFRTFNFPWQTAVDNLTATHLASPNRVRLDWNANPQGCENPVQRPFVVFRRKGTGAWHQVSPPFTCTVSGPTEEALTFTDSDVEPGRSYQYRVIRVGSEGEFLMTFGPATVDVP